MDTGDGTRTPWPTRTLRNSAPGRALDCGRSSWAARSATFTRTPSDAAYISAFAALGGSAVGALASFMTTSLTLHSQERANRWAREISRRENLYRSGKRLQYF